VSIGFAVDASGSMAGRTWDVVCAAVTMALAHLEPHDRFAVVAYADAPQVLLPAGPATFDRVDLARECMAAIRPDGRTDLAAGWLSSCIEADTGRDGRLGRCLLLTDGQANQGILSRTALRNHASALRDRGISTSTLGVGDDFDERLLAAIASGGGGVFHDIATGRGIPAAMEQEVGDALRIVGSSVTVELTLPPGVEHQVFADVATTPGTDGGIRFHLPDMVGGQRIDLPVHLRIPPCAGLSRLPISASMAWDGPVPGSIDAEMDILVVSDPRLWLPAPRPAVLSAVAQGLVAIARRAALDRMLAQDARGAVRILDRACLQLDPLVQRHPPLHRFQVELRLQMQAHQGERMTARDMKRDYAHTMTTLTRPTLVM
jgi:Ca-activated chloride channel family protein